MEKERIAILKAELEAQVGEIEKCTSPVLTDTQKG